MADGNIACCSTENSKESLRNIKQKSKRRQFRWTPEMIENLIDSLQSYKSCMLFKNFDFDADKSAQYSAIREAMADLYLYVDVTLFGQVEIPSLPTKL